MLSKGSRRRLFPAPLLTTCSNLACPGSRRLVVDWTHFPFIWRKPPDFVRQSHSRRAGAVVHGHAVLWGPGSHAGNHFMPTIAIVDDDRNILTSVSMALEEEGYRIVTYTDGSSALDGFSVNPPDLAILDIKMPRMD